VTLVGHDVGGQIVFAYLHAFPCELARAVMMNIAVPGVEPWDEVERNPHIWHFAFHKVPGLPEQLVADHQRAYFDFFYDILTARPDSIGDEQREIYTAAYARPDALATGFAWYRAFAADEKINREVARQPIPTPVLYLRGDREGGDLDRYLRGLRDSGLANVAGHLIPGSGHFAPDENPDEVAAALRGFIAGA
jgi:pimeloyl-ACP methyl ester carboxylesterase